MLSFPTTAKNNNTPERFVCPNSLLKKDPPEFYRLFLKRSQEDVSDSCNQQGHWTRLSPTFKRLNSHFTRATVGVEFVSRR